MFQLFVTVSETSTIFVWVVLEIVYPKIILCQCLLLVVGVSGAPVASRTD